MLSVFLLAAFLPRRNLTSNPESDSFLSSARLFVHHHQWDCDLRFGYKSRLSQQWMRLAIYSVLEHYHACADNSWWLCGGSLCLFPNGQCGCWDRGCLSRVHRPCSADGECRVVPYVGSARRLGYVVLDERECYERYIFLHGSRSGFREPFHGWVGKYAVHLPERWHGELCAHIHWPWRVRDEDRVAAGSGILRPSCDPWRRHYKQRPERHGVSVVHRRLRLGLFCSRDPHLYEWRLERVESIPELLCERVPALPDLVVSGNRGDLPIKCALVEYGRRECHSFVRRPGKPVLRAGPDNWLGA